MFYNLHSQCVIRPRSVSFIVYRAFVRVLLVAVIDFPCLDGKRRAQLEQRLPHCDGRIETKNASIVPQEVSDWMPEMSGSSCQGEFIFLLFGVFHELFVILRS